MSDETKSKSVEKLIGNRQAQIFGERYRGASLASIKLEEHAPAVRDFMLSKKNFLVFLSNAGVGKTYLAAALVEYAMVNFKSFRRWREIDLFSKLRSSMNEYSHSDYEDVLKYLIDDEFLIIDDIGSTGLTDWRREVIFSVIDYRYNSMKPTVLISNLLKKDFYEVFHERVASRVFAKENYIIEIDNGEDLRQS
jgi:DNA replication protein DnaC